MANWPGQIVNEDEFNQMPAFATQDQAQPRAQNTAQPAPAVQPQGQQFPGDVVDVAPDAQLVDTRVGGFADEAPTEAATQLNPEQTEQFYTLVKDPKSTAQTLIDFAGSHGMALNNAEDIIAGRAKGVPIGDEPMYELPDIGSDGAAGAAGRGALDTLTFGTASKVGAVVGGLERSLAGDGSFSDGYNRVLDNNNAAVAADEKEHPWMRIAGQLIGGLGLPSGLEGVGLKAGTEALRIGATMQEARAAASIAVRNRMAVVGAGYGAAHGAGSADNLSDAATGAIVEGGMGAGAGLALGAVGQAVAPRMAAKAAAARAAPIEDRILFGQAAERQNLDYLPADVQGDGMRQIATRMASGVTNITLGGIPLSEAASRIVEKAKAGRDRIAQAVGVVTDSAGVGQAVQRGANRFMSASEKRGAELYEAIPIKGSTDAVLTNTRTALRELTAGMKSNPQLSKLVAENPRLKQFLDALTPKEKIEPAIPEQQGGMGFGVDVEPVPGSPARPTGEMEGGKLSWEDLKRFRTIIGEFAGQPTLSASLPTKALRKVYAGLSEDMRETAQKAGPRALTQFNRANQYWRGREGRIDNVLGSVLGDDLQKGAESAARQINTWATANTADFGRLGRLIRSLPDDEADTVRASLISRLGRATAGRQDQGGDVFSPATFGTEWAKLDPRAKNILFQGENRKALEDFARVMSGMKASSQFANTSKTALGGNAIALVAGAFASPLGAAGAAGGQIAYGKLLSNVGFAKWLSSASKKPNAPAFLAHVDRLSVVARAEPAIANEVLQLQARLADAFASTPARMAAQEPSDEAGGTQGRARQQQPETQSLQP